MLHRHARNYAKTIFALVTLGLAGACADSSVAPTHQVAFKAPKGFDRTVGVVTFMVNGNTGATQVLGNHTISIPADAICDPEVSSYGMGEWDKPCELLGRSIVITATMLENDAGMPYVDFQPAMRFAPDKEVDLFLNSSSDNEAQMLNIEYCNNLGVCVDESANDSSLVTRRVAGSTVAVRRIKHFSGYMISSGEDCSGTLDVLLDGTLMCNDGRGGLLRRSGYMVASGLAGSRGGRKKHQEQ